MTQQTPNTDPQQPDQPDALAEARRELEEANKQLERRWITEQDIIRRNRAERIVKELEGRGR